MKLCGLAMVRNEADIIEAFVRHNLRYLDELFVVMHAPNDETPHILAKLASEGLMLRLSRNEELAFRKADVMNGLVRDVMRDSGADFLFLLDADEFLKTSSRAVLEASLARVPEDAIPTLKWVSYIPLPDDPAEESNPVTRIRWHRKSETKPTLKVIVGRSFASSGELRIGEGNHYVVRPWGSRDQAVRHGLIADVALAHFPVRTEEQIFAKVAIGVWSRWLDQGKVDREMTLSTHWLSLYERFVDGGALPADVLSELAFSYSVPEALQDGSRKLCDGDLRDQLVFDPIPADYALRYPQSARSSMKLLSRWVEQLIASRPQGVPAQSPVPHSPRLG
jgi:hypothetical protein